ncbi:MAG: arylamine N-acetyltransferase [Pseudomonadota bacterium]
MDLDRYLERIKFFTEPEVNLDTLRAIQYQHLLHIPYEDVDVQLGRRLDFDTQRIYSKIVEQQRGGWCYEMNGLLGWALEEIGFVVMRLSGAANRQNQGDTALGTHLLLEVPLAQNSYLVDVGFGDGLHYPVPLAETQHTHNGFTYQLERMQDGYWRMHNHVHSTMPSFDFRQDHGEAAEAELAQGCKRLQEDPQSPFRQMLIAFRFTATSIESLLGKTAISITPSGRQERSLETLSDVQKDLAERFGITQDITPAWEQIESSHQQYIAYMARKFNP